MDKNILITFDKHISSRGQPITGQKKPNMTFQDDSAENSFSLITQEQANDISQKLNEGQYFFVLDFNHIDDSHLALTRKILNNNGRCQLLNETFDLYLMAFKQLMDLDGEHIKTATILLNLIKTTFKINNRELANRAEMFGVLKKERAISALDELELLLLAKKLKSKLAHKQKAPPKQKI